MKAIAAMSENRAIGRNNKLPWLPIKEDFKWFKEFTTGKILVVGRVTFDKMPPLKNRNIIVLTSNPNSSSGYDPNCNFGYCFRDYNGVIEVSQFSNDQLIIIGGTKTYEKFMPYITEFYVTHVKGEYEADTFMPPFEHLFSNQKVVKEFDGHRVIKYSKS